MERNITSAVGPRLNTGYAEQSKNLLLELVREADAQHRLFILQNLLNKIEDFAVLRRAKAILNSKNIF
ncbi:MAG: hypothetical protein LBD99_04065 [Candidatus Margulisbacteria bacterium]|jgi:hypothetical protein|nr:hypothetical protein [Candidatus Margulisiibacteriota bacterium]